MRKLISTLFFLFSCTVLFAQAEVVGRVVDSTNLTLPGANVVLLRTSDSLLTAFATTDNKGSFRMQDVPADSYIMRITFLGFERPDKLVSITPDGQYLDFGDLKMYPAGFLLGGVEVTADRIPIQMRGDTMMFDAEAFAVGENAVVEDLIRRLPGMSVDGAGNITYRGRPINEVMINGKQVNPLRIKLPSGEKLKKDDLEAFHAARAEIERLRDESLPSPLLVRAQCGEESSVQPTAAC